MRTVAISALAHAAVVAAWWTYTPAPPPPPPPAPSVSLVEIELPTGKQMGTVPSSRTTDIPRPATATTRQNRQSLTGSDPIRTPSDNGASGLQAE